MRTWNLGRMGLKQLDRIFTVFPLKVTVAIVLEKLSGTSAGSCKAHKSRDSLSPRIGGAWRRNVFAKKLERNQSVRYPRTRYSRVKDNVGRRKKVDLAMCYTGTVAPSPMLLWILCQQVSRNVRGNVMRNVQRNVNPRVLALYVRSTNDEERFRIEEPAEWVYLDLAKGPAGRDAVAL